MNKTFLRTIFCVLTAMVLAVSANATITISGSAWLVPDTGSSSAAENAVIGSIPGSTANVTFTINSDTISLNPTDSSSNFDFNEFLVTAGNASSVSYHIATASTLLGFSDPSIYFSGGTNYGACGQLYSSQTCGTIFEFTGTAYFVNGQTYSATSDDGATLYVGGTSSSNEVFSDPGPEGASSNDDSGTYTGATGLQSFTLVYAECCGAPAELVTTFAEAPAGTPEPTSVLLLGTLLFIVATVLRRHNFSWRR